MLLALIWDRRSKERDALLLQRMKSLFIINQLQEKKDTNST